MAVDVTANPWRVVAADVSATPIWPPGGNGVGNVFIENIVFGAYGADGDKVTVKDGNGKVIWKGDGASDLRSVSSGKIGLVHKGVIVDAMDSGEVLIYHK